MRRPVNVLRVNVNIPSNSKARVLLDPKGWLWNKQLALERLWGHQPPLVCVLRRTDTNVASISQLSYTAMESKGMYFSVWEMCFWGRFVPVLLLLALWGIWMQPLQWARWWCLRNKIPSVHFSKGFILTAGFLPPANYSTGSMRLLVLDKYVSMVP